MSTFFQTTYIGKSCFVWLIFHKTKSSSKNILMVLMWAIPLQVPGRLEMVVAKQPGQSLRKPPKWRTPWTGKPSKGWEINSLGLSQLYSLSWGFDFKISIFVCNYHKFVRNYLAIKVTRHPHSWIPRYENRFQDPKRQSWAVSLQ